MLNWCSWVMWLWMMLVLYIYSGVLYCCVSVVSWWELRDMVDELDGMNG